MSGTADKYFHAQKQFVLSGSKRFCIRMYWLDYPILTSKIMSKLFSWLKLFNPGRHH